MMSCELRFNLENVNDDNEQFDENLVNLQNCVNMLIQYDLPTKKTPNNIH